MLAPARRKRVSFESSNIRGVRVLGIHADGAMTDTVLSMYDEFGSAKSNPLLTRPDP
jgi:hypothetical protein